MTWGFSSLKVYEWIKIRKWWSVSHRVPDKITDTSYFQMNSMTSSGEWAVVWKCRRKSNAYTSMRKHKTFGNSFNRFCTFAYALQWYGTSIMCPEGEGIFPFPNKWAEIVILPYFILTTDAETKSFSLFPSFTILFRAGNTEKCAGFMSAVLA